MIPISEICHRIGDPDWQACSKTSRPLASQRYYGGYISFACRWVPYGARERPLRTLH